MVDTVRHAAEAALETTQRLAEEAQRKIREATEKAEQVAKSVADKITDTTEAKQIVDEVSEVASAAADEGVDITEAVNAAVEVALKKVEGALKAAIDAVNTFLREAQNKLFGFLEGILSKPFHFLLEPVKAAAQCAVDGLESFGNKLKSCISLMLGKIKVTVQAFVRKVGEVLGPIWEFVKKLWKLLFGVEPEQCQLAAQWFEERMKRTEKQLLALIKKHTYLELLPPDENAWKSLVLEFLDREDSVPAWRAHRARNVVQLTWDEPFTDELGGQQRVQISVLYFRWHTEEFRKVSSGFLGVLAMVSAVDRHGEPYEPPPLKVRREQPLQMDAVAMKKIYDEIAPHMRLKPIESDRDSARFGGSEKTLSRQLKFRDDDGVWRTVDVK